jgi:hypothetical protein
MEFCAGLRDGKYDRADILRAEIVELYRALNTRGIIQELYKEKLREANEKGIILNEELSTMEEVIDDEGETDDHIDHLDMRFKLFVGTAVDRSTEPVFNDELEAINNEWMAICKKADLFTLMAVTSGIEDWYAPMSKFFEDEYRKRGFTDEELELFIAHQDADVEHSQAQFDILERNISRVDLDNVKVMLKRTFDTSRAYDRMKRVLAESDHDLEHLVKKLKAA